jgi:hypothetical protein
MPRISRILSATDWFRQLAQRGKDAGDYLSTFNDFLVRAVSSGRRIMGYEKDMKRRRTRCARGRKNAADSRSNLCPMTSPLPDFQLSGYARPTRIVRSGEQR